MECVKCGGKTRVIRTIQICGKTIRIRKCKKCGHEFTTEEKAGERSSQSSVVSSQLSVADAGFKERRRKC
jgi:transcription elongation factor Elf1